MTEVQPSNRYISFNLDNLCIKIQLCGIYRKVRKVNYIYGILWKLNIFIKKTPIRLRDEDSFRLQDNEFHKETHLLVLRIASAKWVLGHN